MASNDITEAEIDISGNACYELDVLLGPVFKQLNESFKTLCHNGQKFRKKSKKLRRRKESNHIDKYRSGYQDEVKTLASNIENLSQMYTRLPKPSTDHGGFYRGELTSKMSNSLCGLGYRNTYKQPSAEEIVDMQIRLENQDLKKQLTELEQRIAELQQSFDTVQTEKTSANQRYAEKERQLEAELQEKNDLSVRCADRERSLEAELQEKNDLLGRCADLKRSLEAELQEKNELLGRYADLERSLEAELQEKNDLLGRYADLERSLEAELQEKNDLLGRYADLESSLEAELQKKNDLIVRYADLERSFEAELQETNDLLVRYAVLEKRMETELQEKNDLSVRLSAIIASRIKDGNTTIVDLSDENRPTKLAEYFSELYDNEWTDCFDELENQAIEESESIRILLKILTDIFNACLQWSTDDYFLLVQRAIDRTYIGQAENFTDERPNITGSNTQPKGNEETPQKTDNTEATIESGDNAQDEVPSVSEGGPCDKRQESKADSESNEETPQTIDQTHSTLKLGENAHVKTPSISEDGSSDKRREPKTDSESNEQTLQTTELTEPTVEPKQNSQVEVPSTPDKGSSDDRREPKTDSESNEGTPQKTGHTQATIVSGENGHGDAQSMKEDEEVLETTDPAITAKESREKDQSDEPFHDNTNNGSSSEDQDGSRKAVTQGLRGQDETHTDERSSITEEAESESENKCEVKTPSASGDGPSKKEHESNAEASVYVDGPGSTEAGQNGQGEEPSSTEDKEKLPPREKEEVELPNDLLQPIKEIKKRRALKVLPTIHEFVRRKIPTLVQARFASTYFQTYIQKCTEFSWLAVVQDPPLVLLADGGTKFDRKLFKEYMRRGQLVEFVVWPALLVEEGGAILSKGVAQGINKPQ